LDFSNSGPLLIGTSQPPSTPSLPTHSNTHSIGSDSQPIDSQLKLYVSVHSTAKTVIFF